MPDKSGTSKKVFVQLNTFIRPWNDPEKGRMTNVPSVNQWDRIVINGIVNGEDTGWWELNPLLAEKLELAVSAAEFASGLNFRCVCTAGLPGTKIIGFHMNGAVNLKLWEEDEST